VFGEVFGECPRVPDRAPTVCGVAERNRRIRVNILILGAHPRIVAHARMGFAVSAKAP